LWCSRTGAEQSIWVHPNKQVPYELQPAPAHEANNGTKKVKFSTASLQAERVLSQVKFSNEPEIKLCYVIMLERVAGLSPLPTEQ
jgi:hypothetical protein